MLHRPITVIAAALIAAAGPAGSDTAFITIQDGSGLGARQIWLDDTNCTFNLGENNDTVSIDLSCGEGMLIQIEPPEGQTLQPDLYLDTREWSYGTHPFLACRGCYEEIGWFEIHELHRDPVSGEVETIAIDLESHCGGDVPSIQAQVRIGSSYPIDGSLEPFQLRLFGRPGDPIFQGNSVWLHEGSGDLSWADATFGHVELGYIGNDGTAWRLEFAAPDGESLALGSYPGARVQPNPSGDCPRLLVQTDDLDCSGGEGWFRIDELWYDPLVGLLRFGATFEQYCGEAGDQLHGQIRYLSLASWTQPRIDATLVVDSEPGDPVGDGGSYLHQDEDSFFESRLLTSATRIEYRFDAESSSGAAFALLFSPPDGLRLAPGLYTGAVGPHQAPVAQPVLEIDRSPNPTSCTSLDGDFLVHEVAYDADGGITTLAIDFRQHCYGATGELTGQLRYASDVSTDVVFVDRFDRGLFRHWSDATGLESGCW